MLIGIETIAPITGIKKDAINIPTPTNIVLKIRTINLS
jgi:hypothetical protein